MVSETATLEKGRDLPVRVRMTREMWLAEGIADFVGENDFLDFFSSRDIFVDFSFFDLEAGTFSAFEAFLKTFFEVFFLMGFGSSSSEEESPPEEAMENPDVICEKGAPAK